MKLKLKMVLLTLLLSLSTVISLNALDDVTEGPIGFDFIEDQTIDISVEMIDENGVNYYNDTILGLVKNITIPYPDLDYSIGYSTNLITFGVEGDYPVTITIKNADDEYAQTFYVHIVDTTPPYLLAPLEYTHEVGEFYPIECGDNSGTCFPVGEMGGNYDPTTPGSYVLEISLTDLSGNIGTYQVAITVTGDAVNPEETDEPVVSEEVTNTENDDTDTTTTESNVDSIDDTTSTDDSTSSGGTVFAILGGLVVVGFGYWWFIIKRKKENKED